MKNEKLKDPGKRKMLLILPLLVLPFLTLAFWALGGGKNDGATAQKQVRGLNLQLPDAQLKDDKGENKLSYYEQAEKDSAKWRQGMENDPFFQSGLNDLTPKKEFGYDPYPLQTGNYGDPNEQKVYQKLSELNGHLKNAEEYKTYSPSQDKRYASNTNASLTTEDINRLEEMMKHSSDPVTKDPEVEQLNGMMDRILDIQHPERVKQRINENSEKNKAQVFAVKGNTDHYSISLLDTGGGNQPINAFYSVDDGAGAEEQNAIEAVIHETQDLVDGSIMKMRLVDDVRVDDVRIPKGNFVFGKATLQGERLQIEIHSVRKNNALFPVKLVVYDLDGMKGIHIPGAITRDVAKQSADNSLQNIEMSSIDPSFKAQATTAGLNAARTLLTKKAKLVRVRVKAGYKILLREKNK